MTRGNRDRQEGADHAGQHAAGRQREQDPDRVQPQLAAHHDRIEDVALDLLDGDDHGQDHERGPSPFATSATSTAAAPATNAPTIGKKRRRT